MSLSSLPQTQCTYMPNASYGATSHSEECSFVLYKPQQVEESSYFGTETSILSDMTESFDCNEMLCKPEEEQTCYPEWNPMQCQEEEEEECKLEPRSLCEESLLSLHYNSGSEDSGNEFELASWLSFVDQENEEHFHCMKRMQERETHLRRCMTSQKTEEVLNPFYLSYRSLLLEWICDVCMELALTPETLHTTVYLVDSFMLKQPLDYRFLQPLSCACILLAGKQEEREENVPTVEELCYLCRNSFTCKTLITMEKLVLEVLEWNILTCNVIHFLRFFLFQWCQQSSNRLGATAYRKMSKEIGDIALYLANRAMMDKNFFIYSPSCLAAASIYSALFGLFGEGFLKDAANLQMLWRDGDIFLGECISKYTGLFKSWLLEKESLPLTSHPIRVCSPTCIQQMFASFYTTGDCTSF